MLMLKMLMLLKILMKKILMKMKTPRSRQLKYYVPGDPSFPVIDSWNSDHMFQVTVSSSHPIKVNATKFEALRKKLSLNHIVFVVPDYMFKRYKRQPLVNANSSRDCRESAKHLRQFVIGIPTSRQR